MTGLGGGVDQLPRAGAALQIAAQHRREQLEHGGRVLTHPLHLHQLLRQGVQHAGQGAEPVNELVGQRVYIPLGDGKKQYQLQHPVVGPALNPPGEKFLLHPPPVSGVNGLLFLCHGRSAPPIKYQSVRDAPITTKTPAARSYTDQQAVPHHSFPSSK